MQQILQSHVQTSQMKCITIYCTGTSFQRDKLEFYQNKENTILKMGREEPRQKEFEITIYSTVNVPEELNLIKVRFKTAVIPITRHDDKKCRLSDTIRANFITILN